ncbi:MAG TPA: DUF4124 domain-containing protein [Burkholderiaceae bacterium]|nr:DUF4124 domain-containing protein [Burkholderiaceae bacterium]
MRRTTFLLLGLIAAGRCAAVGAPDGIYVCVDADGHKTYQNSSEGASCRRVDGVVASIPSSDLARGQSPRPVRPMISPAAFPRVDINTQRLRDADRRHILQEELRTEEEHLAHLRTEFNQGQPTPVADEIVGSVRYQDRVQRLFDDIERSEGNIASLRRELTPIRY